MNATSSSRHALGRSGQELSTVTLLIILCLFALSPSRAGAQTMDNVHVSSSGEQGNWYTGYGASISDDKRWVAFDTDATNIVAGDTNGARDCFVHDRTTGATILVSRSTAGGVANGTSLGPNLSSSGRYVAFASTATNLVGTVVTTPVNVFRLDRDTDADGIFDEPGATAMILVSVNSAGVPANSYSNGSSISDDGNRIAFDSEATNLVTGDTNGGRDCFVRTVSPASTIRVSLTSSGGQANGPCFGPSISGNGNVVAFNTASPTPDNLVPGDTNGMPDVFVRNIALATTVRASVSSAGAQADQASGGASVSDDGTIVAFSSWATNLIPADGNESQDVFVRNLSASTTTRASVSLSGGDGNGEADDAHVSGNGVFVAFESSSTNLTSGAIIDFQQIFVRDLAAGATALASRAADDGQIGNYTSSGPRLSNDGLCVAFGGEATNLGPGADTNGAIADEFVRCGPFLGPPPSEPPPPPPPPDSSFTMCGQNYDSTDVDVNPVAFSVNGPVDPHTEGIRYARGGPFVPPPPGPPLAGNPVTAGVRVPPVPQAEGLTVAITPGDVADYDVAEFPSEAVMFQSTPLPPPYGDAPDGTNNQIVAAIAMGLVAGPPVASPMWTAYAPPRDNIDAFSFGEDYFPDSIAVGFADSMALPPPPMRPGPYGPEPATAMTAWIARTSLYDEPVVSSDAPGISFRFSIDPWAIGLPLTSVEFQSTGADVGAGFGWTSGGDAAGDVFGTPTIARVGGVAIGGGLNVVVHDDPDLALAPGDLAMRDMEDDLDALECVGENDSTWMFPLGPMLRPGNLHARVEHVIGSGLPGPGDSFHDPVNVRPLFFSVTRSSTGEPFTAVRSNFVADGAAADIFVAVKDPAVPSFPGDGMNLLFIDEAELGLYGGGMGGTDDLDGLILCVCDEFRPMIITAINEILGIIPPPGGGMPIPGGASPWVTDSTSGAIVGGGMTVSITKYLKGSGREIPDDCIHVGFSVTTDAIGLEYTAVDYEAGGILPPPSPLGISAAAGDIFYAEVDGEAANTNYLWYEETSLGLDAGEWVNGFTVAGFDSLADNLNALDAIFEPPDTTTMDSSLTDVGEASGLGAQFELEANSPNPFNPRTTVAYSLRAEGVARLTIHDVQGRLVRTLVNEMQRPGRHTVAWDGTDGDGRQVASGNYFMRLAAGRDTETRKMTMLK